MTRFIIVRHGFSVGNKEKRFTGQLDLPLDEIGLSQARSGSRYILENYAVDKVCASDLSRAYETVRPIADALGLEVDKRKALREVDVGLWQGELIVDVAREYPDVFTYYKQKPGLARFPGGEDYADMQKRVLDAMREIATENEGKTVVVGCHGGVIRVMRAAWMGIALENIEELAHVPNGSITEVEYDDGNVTFVHVGYVDHLDDKTTEEGVRG